MRKINFALLLTSLTLLITSCQNSKTTVKAEEPTSTEEETSSENDTNNPTNDPTNASTALIEIHCDDGCLVKKSDETSYSADYSGYVNLTSTATTLNFEFKKVEDYYDFPSVSAERYTTSGPEPFSNYTYNQESGLLSFELSSTNAVTDHFVFNAYTDPAVEIILKDPHGGGADQVKMMFSLCGSIKAVDFGTDREGNNHVSVGTQIFSDDDPTRVVSFAYFDENGISTIKVYGKCSKVLLNNRGDAEEAYNMISEVRYNHDVTKFYFETLFNLPYLNKLYFGKDIKEIVYPRDFKEAVSYGVLQTMYLKEIEVSKDNHYFDSREDCNCLIDSKSNTLLLGGSEGFIPEGVKKIATGAYSKNQLINYVSLPDSLTTIEELAFARSSISYLDLSPNLASVSNGAFYRCLNLMVVDFSRLEHIPSSFPYQAFIDCDNLFANNGLCSFLHSDLYVLSDIFHDLREFDSQWNEASDKFASPNDLNTLPSAIVINKVLPNQEYPDIQGTRVVLDPGINEPYYSTAALFDPLGQVDRRNWSDWYNEEDHIIEVSCGTGWAEFNDGQYRSSYMVMIYPQQNDSGSLGEVGINFQNNKEDKFPVHNDKFVTCVKYFGNYTSIDEKGYIAENSFKGLHALKHVLFSDVKNLHQENGLLHYIEASAFEDTGITSIKFPSSLLKIGYKAFANCPNLKNLTFDETGRPFETKQEQPNLLKLASYSFLGDVSISAIDLPWFACAYDMLDFNTFIPAANPFAGCTSLTQISCNQQSEWLGVNEEGVLINRGNSDQYLTCVNSYMPIRTYSAYEYCPVAPGFFSTIALPNLVVGMDSLVEGMYEKSYTLDNLFAYSAAKKLILVNPRHTGDVNKFQIGNYAFANCSNLEILDLSQLEGILIPMQEEEKYDPDTVFEGTNENFKIKVRSDDLENYQTLFDIKDVSKFIIV